MAKNERYIGGGVAVAEAPAEVRGEGEETTPDRDAEATPPVEPSTAPATAPEAAPEPVTAEPVAAESEHRATLIVTLAEAEEEKEPELIFTTVGAARLMEQCQHLERFSISIQRTVNAVIAGEAPKGMSHGVQRWLLQTYSLLLLVEEKASEGQAILTGKALCSPDGDVIL